MKEKLESFNSSKELRELAYKRALIKQERNSEVRNAKMEGKMEGKNEGELLAKYETVKKVFLRNYPQEDTRILEGLSIQQYDKIFDMLLENANIKDIQTYIMKNTKN